MCLISLVKTADCFGYMQIQMLFIELPIHSIPPKTQTWRLRPAPWCWHTNTCLSWFHPWSLCKGSGWQLGNAQVSLHMRDRLLKRPHKRDSLHPLPECGGVSHWSPPSLREWCGVCDYLHAPSECGGVWRCVAVRDDAWRCVAVRGSVCLTDLAADGDHELRDGVTVVHLESLHGTIEHAHTQHAMLWPVLEQHLTERGGGEHLGSWGEEVNT